MNHQYICRESGGVLDEEFFGDRIVGFLYSRVREQAPALFNLALGPGASSLLGFLNFDLSLAPALLGNRRFLARCGVDLSECLDPPTYFTTPRRIFERRIRYWDCRPLPSAEDAVVSPADARLLLGSLKENSLLWIKDKFFRYPQLLGTGKEQWQKAFAGGDFAIFRLTPDKYHYSHTPVAGRIVDFYELDGVFHSCNPAAVVEVATPYSLNRRVVTIIDSDVAGGSGVGLVAMIEVTALMIGQVVQGYSEQYYDEPQRPAIGMFLRRGQPKSMYRPGSSTDILLFEPDRVDFAADLIGPGRRPDVNSRYSLGFGQPLVESEVRVRSLLASPRKGGR